MNYKRLFITLITSLTLAVVVTAENDYAVTSPSLLNVRKSPSTSPTVLVTFNSVQHTGVGSISKDLAKVKYNGHVGYVSETYISQLPKSKSAKFVPKNVKPTKAKPIVASKPVNNLFREIKSAGDYDVETPLSIGYAMSDNINIYLSAQVGLGYSNFCWNDGSVNGTISYSGDIVGQLYFENSISFIPANWCSELALGYDKRGAAKYGMDYIHARVYPFGYRLPIDPINVVIKAGPTLGFALNDFDNRWSSDFQVGVGGGFQIEWRQFAVGYNVEYDFTEVSSSCGQTLNNIVVLGTISYKFAKFGH